MKKQLLLFITLFTFSLGYSQCPTADVDGEVVLASQLDIDEFKTGGMYENCTTITGKLVIGHKNFTENLDIVDLSPLSGITSITGGLDLRSNHALTSISSLSSLTSVGPSLSFYWNPKLVDLDGLQGITSITGLLYMQYNGFVSLNGLDNLTSIGGFLGIYENASLTSFSGLNSLATVGDYFYVQKNSNAALTDFTGFNGLTSVGTSFTIESNNNITSLNGFDLLNSIGTTFNITTNAELTSLNGIESLTHISTNGGTSGFQINANPKLTDISGMINVDHTDISTLTIRNNTLLSTCAISNVCAYMDAGGSRVISGNATGCANATEIQAACTLLSVSDYLLKEAISIYPNPVLDQLNISVKTEINIERLELYSIDGRLIKSQQYELQSMDLSNVSTGIYFLKISSDKGQINARIVKQ